MADFVFAEYVLALKRAWKGKVANEKLISMLYSTVAIPAELDGKGDRVIDCSKTTASDIINRKANPHLEIQKHSQDAVVLEGISDHFAKLIIPKLQPSKIPGLISELIGLLEFSDLLPDRKAELVNLADSGKNDSFLALVYLESLLPANKANSSHEEQTVDDDDAAEMDFADRLPPVSVPNVIAPNERPYVYALLSAYGEREGVAEFTYELLDSYPKHKEHYERQRRDYYAAETVRRGTRDIALEGEQTQFEILEDEIYEGVIDVYEDDFEDGLQRLRHVLSQASKVTVARCWISRKTTWIGNAEKKGVCHFLVNEGRLRGWVFDES